MTRDFRRPVLGDGPEPAASGPADGPAPPGSSAVLGEEPFGASEARIALHRLRDALLAERAAHRATTRRSEEGWARFVELEEALRDQNEALATLDALVANAPVGIGFWDRSLRCVRLNDALAEVGGRPAEAHLGRPIAETLLLSEPAVRRLREGLATGEPLHVVDVSGPPRAPAAEKRHWLAHCYPVRSRAGDVVGLGAVVTEVTGLKRVARQLAHQATHDPLTNLPNRALFLDRLHHALARTGRHPSSLAVLYLDLDHFKEVNDSLGHDAGDDLLVAVAERLRGVLRPTDTVARLGGDEFAMLCEELDSELDAVAVAERILDDLARPVVLEEGDVRVTPSIGIAVATTSNDAGDALLRQADAAMYQAKGSGRARYELFDDAVRDRAAHRRGARSALRRALDREELRVHYQPVVSLRDGSVVGAEALVRWEHPERGLLAPADFVPLAEANGLVVPLGAWVLERACLQAAQWCAERPGEPFRVHVNLSASQLVEPNLVDSVAQAVAGAGLDPNRLCLEITETVLMEDADVGVIALGALKALGVYLEVDDFGTGYSSLSHLRHFPVDGLKVDRSFVAGLGRSGTDSAIVAAVVRLARDLRIDAIAEGVETAEQVGALRRLGCDLAQGYHFGRPEPSERIGSFSNRIPPASA